jgi:hypothetical protein
MNLPFAPIKEALLDASGTISQTWIQFFTTLGTGLSGEWSKSEYKLTIDNNGVDLIPTRTVLAQKGSTIEISMHFDTLKTFLNANFSINETNNKNLTFEDSYLNIYDVGGILLGGAYASGSVISIPNVSSTGHCTISGTLILKETQNNIGGV